jgi:SPX domain protein involved in polyphosphate accumulation
MAQDITTFKRREIKYLLEEEQYEQLKSRLQERLVADSHGKSTICNIYYDTPDFRLIRQSLEKPMYKEKLRLRSYGVPSADSQVFVELKKKYDGIVYKRRETMTLDQSNDYMESGVAPEKKRSQIMKEIDWFRHYYKNLGPAMHISYDREAYYSREDSSLRITFDENIRWRCMNLKLDDGVGGKPILKTGQHLMEIKVGGSMPLWLSRLLDDEGIYPTSFSKYGRAYRALTA